tara:strand:- start:13917 stop:15590 length:1674 start_codon:yes stop_codon:yes gene_type:complete
MFYIITIFAIAIIIVLYCRKCNILEGFSDSNILTNGNFNNGKDIIGSTALEKNFKIVNLDNPSDSSYVLKQLSFNQKSYNINVDVSTNTFYYLSYWRSNDIEYNGNESDIEIYGNDQKLSNCGKLIEKTNIGGYSWSKIVYIVNSSNYTTLIIKLGSSGMFDKGFRLFADIVFRKYLPNLPGFNYQDRLESICIVDTENDTKILKSKTGRNDLTFDSKAKVEDKMISLKNRSGMMTTAEELMGKSFSIVIGYHGNNNENGTIFKATANNDIKEGTGGGVMVDLQYNIGVIDNKLKVAISNKKYTYDIGIANKMIHFFIIYKDDETLNVFIDTTEIKPTNVQTLVKDREPGTCPDGWKFLGDNNCQPIQQNKGTLSNNVSHDIKNRDEWMQKNTSVKWENCKNLDIGDIAPSGNTTCNINTLLNYSNEPVLINQDKNLTGLLKSIIVYKKALSSEEVIGIHKYLLKQYYDIKSVEDSFYNKPDLMASTDCVDNTPFNEPDPCPFDNKSICKTAECISSNWITSENISPECKNIVNTYCKKHSDDTHCTYLRNEKLKKS